MTVENTISKTSKQIMGASTYNFSFDVLLKDPTEEIAKRSVKVAISDGMTETVLTYGKDYTVKLNADRKGGTVTLTDPKNSNYSLVIYRQYDATQGSDYNDFDSFPAETLEQGLDKLTMLVQELKEQISRTVKVGLISGVDPSVLVQHVERIYGSIGNVDIVASDKANIDAVAANKANIDNVAANKANIDNVAGNRANIIAVAKNEANINNVAANKANIDTVAKNIGSVNTVAQNIDNVNTVAENIGSVNTCADNIDFIKDAKNQATISKNAATSAANSAANSEASAQRAKEDATKIFETLELLTYDEIFGGYPGDDTVDEIFGGAPGDSTVNEVIGGIL